MYSGFSRIFLFVVEDKLSTETKKIKSKDNSLHKYRFLIYLKKKLLLTYPSRNNSFIIT